MSIWLKLKLIKFKDEAVIYKVSGSFWETLNNSWSSPVSPDMYLDLKGVEKDNVKNYANNMIVYNVYGYTGQLMMINSKYHAKVDTTNSGLSTSNNDNFGLAFAVTQNSSNQDKDDYKGILNGDKSIQKASDFKLNDSAKSSKISSEITRNDINTLNGSFLKDSSDFSNKSINDADGKITIECKLYKVPWFASELPKDISPKIITHEYKTDNKITNKISRKTLSTSTDYDFMNMRPTKIQPSDVENLDPFPSFIPITNYYWCNKKTNIS